MIPFRVLIFAAAGAGCLIAPDAARAAFDLSENYVPSAQLASGYYICRTEADLYSATWTFDLVAEGKYRVRSSIGKGMAVVAPDGSLTFVSGYLAPDEHIRTSAMSAIRIEDGNPTIIIRADHGDAVAMHYCPLIE